MAPDDFVEGIAFKGTVGQLGHLLLQQSSLTAEQERVRIRR